MGSLDTFMKVGRPGRGTGPGSELESSLVGDAIDSSVARDAEQSIRKDEGALKEGLNLPCWDVVLDGIQLGRRRRTIAGTPRFCLNLRMASSIPGPNLSRISLRPSSLSVSVIFSTRCSFCDDMLAIHCDSEDSLTGAGATGGVGLIVWIAGGCVGLLVVERASSRARAKALFERCSAAGNPVAGSNFLVAFRVDEEDDDGDRSRTSPMSDCICGGCGGPCLH